MHIHCDARRPRDPDPPCPLAAGEELKRKPVHKDVGE